MDHTNCKILIVEDEFVIAQDLLRITTGLGYSVVALAKSADEALTKVNLEVPELDLILMDVNIIGNLDGIELSRKLKSQCNVPSMFVTSYFDADTLNRMNAASPLGYILKPFEKRDIEVALESSIKKLQWQWIQAKKGLNSGLEYRSIRADHGSVFFISRRQPRKVNVKFLL